MIFFIFSINRLADSAFIVKPTINETHIEGGVPNPASEGEVCCFLKCLLIFRFYYSLLTRLELRSFSKGPIGKTENETPQFFLSLAGNEGKIKGKAEL